MPKKKKESIFTRWKEHIKSRSGSRPSNTVSYGSTLDRTTISLPKSVEEQLKLVNMMYLLDSYPNDWKIRLDFLNEIVQHTLYLNKPVTVEMLGYESCEELIALYCDLLLRPLSLRAAEKLERTIMTLLPAQMDSKES